MNISPFEAEKLAITGLTLVSIFKILTYLYRRAEIVDSLFDYLLENNVIMSEEEILRGKEEIKFGIYLACLTLFGLQSLFLTVILQEKFCRTILYAVTLCLNAIISLVGFAYGFITPVWLIFHFVLAIACIDYCRRLDVKRRMKHTLSRPRSIF